MDLAKRAPLESAYPSASHAWTTLRMRTITYQQPSFGAIDCGCTILVRGWGNGEAREVGSGPEVKRRVIRHPANRLFPMSQNCGDYSFQKQAV